MQSNEVCRRRILSVHIDGPGDGVRVRAVVIHELAEENFARAVGELLVCLNRLGGDAGAGHLATLGEKRIAQFDQVVGVATGGCGRRRAYGTPDALEEAAGLFVHFGLFFFSARAHSARIWASPSMYTAALSRSSSVGRLFSSSIACRISC